MLNKRLFGMITLLVGVMLLLILAGCDDNSNNKVNYNPTVVDGTWSRNSGEFIIKMYGNNWVYAEDGYDYSKGTWSSSPSVTVFPYTGIFTLTISQMNFGNGWENFPLVYSYLQTNSVTVTIDSTGKEMKINNPTLTTYGVWGTMTGTYTKHQFWKWLKY